MVAGVVGTLLSSWILNMPTGPCIILVAASQFLVSFLFAPERGLLARLIAARKDRMLLLEQLRSGEGPMS